MGGVSDRWRSIPGGASEKTAEQRREKTCTRTEHYRRVLRALACEVVDRECGADCEKPWSSVHGRLQALFIRDFDLASRHNAKQPFLLHLLKHAGEGGPCGVEKGCQLLAV